MRTPFTVMKRLAISHHTQISILSNEVVRRLSKTNPKREVTRETLNLVETFTRELKISEYGFIEAQQVIGSGIIGWRRKKERRMKGGGEFYHHAASTLNERCRRKLVEKTTWYRRQPREVPNDGMDNVRVEKPSNDELEKVWKPSKPLQKPSPSAIKAVMFIPYTPFGGLLGKVREAEDRLHKLTGYRLKLVERSGSKLEDLLTTNNPWQGQDCGRLQCLLCSTKQKTGKNTN